MSISTRPASAGVCRPAAAEYVDTVVKLNGRWAFRSRALTRLAGRR
jgi:hypothetical protein